MPPRNGEGSKIYHSPPAFSSILFLSAMKYPTAHKEIINNKVNDLQSLLHNNDT